MSKASLAVQLLAGSAALVLTLSAPSVRAAGSISGTRVESIAVGNGGAWVHFTGSIGSSRPGCITSGWSNDLAFNPTTDQGKAWLATLTAAMLAGKTLDAAGSNTCFSLGGANVEALEYIKVYD